MSIAGCATAAGTRRYAARLAASTAADHFRQQHDLVMSSIGLGTYLGHADERTDRMYQEAICRALELGCNVIDSAINYRAQASERTIGAALKQAFDGGRARDEVIITTKGGFIPSDYKHPEPRARIIDRIVQTGLALADEIIGDSHCMTPNYLDNQLSQSLENLGLACVDVYYIHNPETQLQVVPRDEFNRRIRAAFAFLEEAVAAGRICFYGTATWNGYRQPPEARDYLSLAEMMGLAREVAGDDHHFQVVQLPYNLAMPEALTNTNQALDGEMLSPLMAAHRLGLTVMCSASMMQARLTAGLPDFISATLKGLKTDAQRAIQFVRSTPGVTTALIGMSQRSHVEENLEVARVAPPPVEEFFQMFSSGE